MPSQIGYHSIGHDKLVPEMPPPARKTPENDSGTGRRLSRRASVLGEKLIKVLAKGPTASSEQDAAADNDRVTPAVSSPKHPVASSSQGDTPEQTPTQRFSSQEQISVAKPSQDDVGVGIGEGAVLPVPAASPAVQASHSFESRSETNGSQPGIAADALPGALAEEHNARNRRLSEVEAQNVQLVAERRKLQGALRKAHESLKARAEGTQTSTIPNNSVQALSHMMNGEARHWHEHAKKLQAENKQMHLELHQAMLILAAACAGDSIQIEPCSEFVSELYSFLNSAVSSAKHHNSLVSETKELRYQLARAERRAEANADNLLSECENLRFRLADSERRTQDASAHATRLNAALVQSGFSVVEDDVQGGSKSLRISQTQSHAAPPLRLTGGAAAALDELATINEIISLAQRDVLLPPSRMLPPMEAVQQLAEELRKRDALIAELREAALLRIHPVGSTAAEAMFEKVRELARLRMVMSELRASASAKSQPALLRAKLSAEAERLEAVLMAEREKLRVEVLSHIERIAGLHRPIQWPLHSSQHHEPEDSPEAAQFMVRAPPKEAAAWVQQATLLKTDLDDMKKRTAEIEVRVEHLADTSLAFNVAKAAEAKAVEKVAHVRVIVKPTMMPTRGSFRSNSFL